MLFRILKAVSYTHLDVYKRQILPLALFLLVQSGLAQTPKWVEKAKRAVFSVITYDKNDKLSLIHI